MEKKISFKKIIISKLDQSEAFTIKGGEGPNGESNSLCGPESLAICDPKHKYHDY